MTNYPFFVDYIDLATGDHNCETWSERTLNEELNRNEVKILHVELAYSVQEALGLVND